MFCMSVAQYLIVNIPMDSYLTGLELGGKLYGIIVEERGRFQDWKDYDCDIYLFIVIVMKGQQKGKFLFAEPPNLAQAGSIEYRFTIVPKSITQRGPPNNHPKKVVLIKLGNKTAKCDHLDSQLQLDIQADTELDSKQMEASKGMIKIYDVQEDGAEIISCVGAFDIQEILQSKGKLIEIVRNIGSTVFVMEAKAEVIQLEDLSDRFSEESLEFGDHSDGNFTRKKDLRQMDDLKSAINLGVSTQKSVVRCDHRLLSLNLAQDQPMLEGSDVSSFQSLKKIENIQIISEDPKQNHVKLNKKLSLDEFNLKQNEFDFNFNVLKSPKGVKRKDETLTFEDLRKSLKESINNMSFEMSCPEMTQEFQKLELELLGEELISERRKTRQYEEKMDRQHNKIVLLKSRNKNWATKWGQLATAVRSFMGFIKKDDKGQCIFEINQKKQKISMKYYINDESENAFKNILDSIVNIYDQAEENIPTPAINTKKTSSFAEMTQAQENCQEILQQNKKLKQQIQLLKKEAKRIQQLENALLEEKKTVEKLRKQLSVQKIEAKQCTQKMHTIEGVNSYLKEKDHQMQQIIASKQTTIENLRKNLANNNNELDELDEEIAHHKKVVKNMELVIQELKEQIQTRDDLIEEYQKKYGKYKHTRSRDLENHINDCLIWLDQEEGGSMLEQTITQEGGSKKPDRNLLNFIKNSQYLNGLGHLEVLKIQEEVSSLVLKLKQFLGDNTVNSGIQPSFTK